MYYVKEGGLGGASLRKTLNEDLARFYPHFTPYSFYPKLTHFTPVDPSQTESLLHGKYLGCWRLEISGQAIFRLENIYSFAQL